jgi:hypothetical protein
MKKLLILLALCWATAGFGHNDGAWHIHPTLIYNPPAPTFNHDSCGVVLPCNSSFQSAPTFTDGFGYELREKEDYFTFTVYLDFEIPSGFKLEKFEYDGVSFFIDSHYQWVKAITIFYCPPFTHEDAWAIRCKAKELVEKCRFCGDRWHDAATPCYKVYRVEGCKHEFGWRCSHQPTIWFKFCPYCGEKLK